MSNQTGTKRSNETMALERRIAHLEALIKQIPSRFSFDSSAPNEFREAFTQAAHGFTVGQVVYSKYVGPDSEWELAWAFSDLEGNFSRGAFGVVSRVRGADKFEVTTAGFVTALDSDIPGRPLADDDGIEFFLTEDVDDPGKATLRSKTSGMHIATFSAQLGGYFINIYRQGDTSFSLSTITPASAIDKIIYDDHSAAASLATYTSFPNPAFLRYGLCKFSATEVVVVNRGKIVNYTTTTDAPGIFCLGSSGAREAEALWHGPTAIRNRPKIYLGYYDGSGSFFFEPRLDQSVVDAWDVVDASGFPTDSATFTAGQTVIWDATRNRFVPGSSGLSSATGPSVLAQPAAGVGAVGAFQATVDNQVLSRQGGALSWSAVITALVADNAITAAKLADAVAYTVVGNGTSSTADPTGITAADGTVLNRKSTTLAFVATMELGTTGAGGGTAKVNFAAGKYFSIDASGNIDFFHSSTARIQISTTGKITCTYPNSNTVVIDTADFVGSSKAVKLRELDICNSSGVAKKILALCSDAY